MTSYIVQDRFGKIFEIFSNRDDAEESAKNMPDWEIVEHNC